MICGSCGAASGFADISPRSQAVLDTFLSHGLQSHTMIERVYGDKDAHLASAAEKEILIRDWAIFSIDPLTGLIIAATLMHPTRKINDVDLEFVKRRYREKSFARGAKREEIEECRNIGLDLDEFISICLKAMQGISGEPGL